VQRVVRGTERLEIRPRSVVVEDVAKYKERGASLRVVFRWVQCLETREEQLAARQ